VYLPTLFATAGLCACGTLIGLDDVRDVGAGGQGAGGIIVTASGGVGGAVGGGGGAGAGAGGTGMSSSGGGGGSGPWLSGWGFRRKLTIPASQVQVPATGTLVHFPAPVLIDDKELSNTAQADASDIRFTTADGMTLLDHEIESFVDAALNAWVRIPVIDGVGDTELYLYWGNPSAKAPVPTIAADVWQDNYLLVLHQSQPSNTQVLDSSPAGHHGTASIAAAGVPDGLFGPALDVGGSFVTFAALDLGDVFTLSAWIHPTASSSSQTIMANSSSNTQDDGFRWFVNSNDGSNDRRVRFETNNGVGSNARSLISVPSAAPANDWAHVTVRVDRTTTSASLLIYGVPFAADNANVFADFANDLAFRVGAPSDGVSPWSGMLDELRISSGLRSDAWMATAVRAMASNDTFVLKGPREAAP
jgi:MSHA biogenesis protein MshQ